MEIGDENIDWSFSESIKAKNFIQQYRLNILANSESYKRAALALIEFNKYLREYDPKKYLITNKDIFQYLANKYKWKKKK